MIDNIFIVFGFALQAYGLYSAIRWAFGALSSAPAPRRSVVKSIKRVEVTPRRQVVKSIRKVETPRRSVVKSIRPV